MGTCAGRLEDAGNHDLDALSKSPEAVAQHIEAILQRFEHRKWQVRFAAVDALHKWPGAVVQHGAAIVQRLEHTGPDVRSAALMALGQSPEAVVQHGAAIVQRFGDTDEGVRNSAVHWLGNSPEAVVQHSLAIVQRLEHTNRHVREAAVTVLERLSQDGLEAIAKHAPEVIQHTGSSECGQLARSALPFVTPSLLAERLHLPDGGEAALRPLGQVPEHAKLLADTVKLDPSLAQLKDAKGDTYIELACKQCRQAMQMALYLLGRFELGHALHFSNTSAVVTATDHGDPARPRRAIKAIKEASQVLAELKGRHGLDSPFVVAVVGIYADASVDNDTFADLRAAAQGLGIDGIAPAEGLKGRLARELASRIDTPERDDAQQPGRSGLC